MYLQIRSGNMVYQQFICLTNFIIALYTSNSPSPSPPLPPSPLPPPPLNLPLSFHLPSFPCISLPLPLSSPSFPSLSVAHRSSWISERHPLPRTDLLPTQSSPRLPVATPSIRGYQRRRTTRRIRVPLARPTTVQNCVTYESLLSE